MSTESVPLGRVLDVEGTLARLGGDQQLFLDMLEFYFEDVPPLYARLRHASHADDASEIRMRAHALKGLVAGCGGIRAAAAAQKVESAGEAGDLAQIHTLVDELGGELQSLTQALTAYRG